LNSARLPLSPFPAHPFGEEILMQLLQRVSRSVALAALLVIAGFCLRGTGAPAEGEVKKTTSYPRHILIIRHAEKTGDKTDAHLSDRGKKRAEVLDQLFMASKDRPDPLPTPDFLFAASNHKDSHRPLETVTPLAAKLKLSINDRFDSKLAAAPAKNGDKDKPAQKEGMVELRAELIGSPKYSGKTILVAWRHSTIPELAKTLKASNVPPKWEDAVFDRVWQITYDDQGNTVFRDLPQRLLPGDAEK
jgi:hypothetical protein